ncbi:MAG: prepilin-type N-terminal cleavage/methylation domain-containing protein [Candidatus Wallbacteria bacterium]|nr:prepilin-type N-terminal cleavage/methylation domain-containing protein [Candidatus Wallbacteria bacterium]
MTRRAFTLTEILVALVLIVAAIVPLLGLNTLSRRRGQQGETQLRAQSEAEHLLEHFAGSLGYARLDALLGDAKELTLSGAAPEIQAALGGVAGAGVSARDVSRQVRLARLEVGGLIRLQATVKWRSTAPDRELSLTCDRLVSNPRRSLAALPPFTSKPPVEDCN